MANRDIRVTISDLQGEYKKVIAELARTVFHELREATPVITGWTKNQWRVSKGAPNGTVNGSPDGGFRDLTEEGEQVAREIFAGSHQIKQIHFTNNAPHINFLNDGFGKQAPAGFVQAAAVRGVEKVRSMNL
jgi:hypothetical protein